MKIVDLRTCRLRATSNLAPILGGLLSNRINDLALRVNANGCFRLDVATTPGWHNGFVM